MFAVMGVFVDFTGDAQLCVTRDQHRVLITHGLTQPWIDEAPPGLLLSPDITAERRLNVIMSLLGNEGTLKGKTVAVLAADDNKGRIKSTVEPELKKLKVAGARTQCSRSAAPTPRPRRRSSTASSRSGRARTSTR